MVCLYKAIGEISIAVCLKCIDEPAVRLLGAKRGQKLCPRCYNSIKEASQEEGKTPEEEYQHVLIFQG